MLGQVTAFWGSRTNFYVADADAIKVTLYSHGGYMRISALRTCALLPSDGNLSHAQSTEVLSEGRWTTVRSFDISHSLPYPYP